MPENWTPGGLMNTEQPNTGAIEDKKSQMLETLTHGQFQEILKHWLKNLLAQVHDCNLHFNSFMRKIKLTVISVSVAACGTYWKSSLLPKI